MNNPIVIILGASVEVPSIEKDGRENRVKGFDYFFFFSSTRLVLCVWFAEKRSSFVWVTDLQIGDLHRPSVIVCAPTRCQIGCLAG